MRKDIALHKKTGQKQVKSKQVAQLTYLKNSRSPRESH